MLYTFTHTTCIGLISVFRCMEHSLHLAAKHFVQTIALHHTKHNTLVGDDEVDSASDGDEDDNEAVDAGDSLGKAIALVKQVSHLMAVLTFYANICDRFASRLKLGHFSVQPALKSGSPRLSSCCGFALAGGCSLASWSILFNSGQYVSELSQTLSRDLTSIRDRQLPSLYYLRMLANQCQTS